MVEQDMTMRAATGVMEAVLRQRQQLRANHGARHTTAHFPSRPKNHTAFLGLYGKMRRHPPCAVVFLPRVPIFTPRAPLAAYGKNCLGPAEPCAAGQIAESGALSYGCLKSTQDQYTRAYQPLAARAVRQPCRTPKRLA